MQNIHHSSSRETGQQRRGRPEEPQGLKSLTLVLKQQSTVPVGGPGAILTYELMNISTKSASRTAASPFFRLHGGQAKRPKILT
jgi:hypothetical protein